MSGIPEPPSEQVELDELAELLGGLLGVDPPDTWVVGRPRGIAFSSRSPDTQRRVYESRLEEIRPRIKQVQSDLANSAYGTPVPEVLDQAIRTFSDLEREAIRLAHKAEFLEASRKLHEAETHLRQVEALAEFPKLANSVRNAIARVELGALSAAMRHPARNYMQTAIDKWTNTKAEVLQELSQATDAQMVQKLINKKRIEFQEKLLEFQVEKNFPRDLTKYQTIVREANAQIHTTNSLEAKLQESPQWSVYVSKRAAFERLAGQLEVDYDFPTLETANQQLASAIDSLAPAAAQAFAAEVGKKDLKKFKTEFADMLSKAPKGFLRELGKQPGWDTQFDDLVKSLGSKPKSPEDQALVKSAITARYGPDISGDFSSKNIVSLYKILGKVPIEHVQSKSLKEVACHKFDDDYVAGDYSSTNKAIRIGSEMSGSDFKSTTLHEVGHAVDDQKGVMKDGGPKEFGSWKVETAESVAEAIYNHFRSELAAIEMWSPPRSSTGVAQLPTPPSAESIRGYLVEVLSGKQTSAKLPNDEDQSLKFKLDAHPAVAICENIRVKNKHWDQGDSGANKNKVGDRVYQEAYAGSWYSYELAQRKGSRIRDYTFRAPGEWFADAYAEFYDKKLSKKHPAYEFLSQDKASLQSK